MTCLSQADSLSSMGLGAKSSSKMEKFKVTENIFHQMVTSIRGID